MQDVPLASALTDADLALARRLGEAAARGGAELWLVGGSVRDAMLGRPVVDIDVASERAAAELGPELASALGGKVGARSEFGTCKLRVGRRSVDLATARGERYERPGALPDVWAADMRADLARRDFSVNAMAASLHPDRFGALLDTEGGAADLAAGVVRALHERSFQDDATRILRAARYASRLDFAVEPATLRWIERDAACLQTISGARLRGELARILDEAAPVPALLLAGRLGALAAIEAGLGAPEVSDALLQAMGRELSGMALLGALVYALPRRRADALCARIAADRRQTRVAAAVARLRDREPELGAAQLGAGVDGIVGKAPREAVEAVAAATPSSMARANLDRRLAADAERPLLDGEELMALGVAEGKAVGEMAQALRHARMDRIVTGRPEAVRFVLKRLTEQQRESGS